MGFKGTIAWTVVMMVGVLPLEAMAEYLCIVPSGENSKNVSVDCTVYAEWNNFVTGFGETAEEVCRNWECPNPLPIDCGCRFVPNYCWTISRSPTDFEDFIGPLTGNVLYLWISDHGWYGDWLAAEMQLSGTLTVASFVPLNGVENWGTTTELLLVQTGPCRTPGIHLIGEIHLAEPVSSVATSWGEAKTRYRQ